MNDSLHIVCPHCHAVNRVPSSRLGHGPSCGQCHQPLFTGNPVELSGANLTRHIERGDLPVVVDFWASWCGPCQMMAPQFAQAARLLEPRARLAKVNTEVEQTFSSRLGIRSIPTLALFRGGREVARQAGAMGTQDIVRWVQAHLG